MKRNIKKLVILVIVPVMAQFTMCAISSAGNTIPHGFKGHYAARGTSYCVHAELGFDTDGYASPKWEGGPGIFEGEYWFNNDGTGSASGVLRGIDLPSPLLGDNPRAWSGTFSQMFTYTVDDAGYMTITTDLGMFVIEKPNISPPFYCDKWTSNGVMSIDGKTITITSGPPTILIQKIEVAPGQWVPIGMQQACILSINLTKLRK